MSTFKIFAPYKVTSVDEDGLSSEILNIEKPKIIEVEDIQSEMLRNFYKDSKKVSNKKMKNFFDYNLKFPTYIEGLNNIRNNLA